MKKNIFTAAACALALACAFTGCKKEEDSVTLKIRTAGMNTAAYQKSYIDDEHQLPMLENGDPILVNNEVIRIEKEENGILTLKVPESDNGYTLVHRGICDAASDEETSFGGQAYIADTQQYTTTNGKQHLALPMAAYVAAGATDVEFKNAASVVKVVVTNLSGKPAYLHSVKAEADSVPLSGTLGFTLTENGISASTETDNARNYVITDSAKHVILECNAIAIPAGGSCGIHLVTAPFSKQKLTFTLNASLGRADTAAHNYVKYMNHEVDLALGNMGVYVFATDFGDPASTPTNEDIPACTRKLFSVGEGKVVNFSPGNLQRNGQATLTDHPLTLRFAPNQYDTGGVPNYANNNYPSTTE